MTDQVKEQIIAMLPRLRAFARSLAPTWDQADDLVQQTVEKGLRKLSSFTPGTRLDSWLFRIMRNTWIDEHRAARPTVEFDEAVNVYPLLSLDGQKVAEATIELRRVRAAMNRLNEDQRAVLMLVCVEGFKYREVAEMLEVPVGTVMSRLARARIALAEDLGMTHSSTDRRKGGAR